MVYILYIQYIYNIYIYMCIYIYVYIYMVFTSKGFLEVAVES